MQNYETDLGAIVSIGGNQLPRPIEHPYLAYDVFRWHVTPVSRVVGRVSVVT